MARNKLLQEQQQQISELKKQLEEAKKSNTNSGSETPNKTNNTVDLTGNTKTTATEAKRSVSLPPLVLPQVPSDYEKMVVNKRDKEEFEEFVKVWTDLDRPHCVDLYERKEYDVNGCEYYDNHPWYDWDDDSECYRKNDKDFDKEEKKLNKALAEKKKEKEQLDAEQTMIWLETEQLEDKIKQLKRKREAAKKVEKLKVEAVKKSKGDVKREREAAKSTTMPPAKKVKRKVIKYITVDVLDGIAAAYGHKFKKGAKKGDKLRELIEEGLIHGEIDKAGKVVKKV